MGANLSVRKGSLLVAPLLLAGTSINVTNAAAGGLDYTAGDSVRVIDNSVAPAAAVVVNLVDVGADASVSGNIISGFDAPGATAATAAGSVVTNQTEAALVENTDYVIDYEGGRIRFLGTGATPAGATFGVAFRYAASSHTRVKLGKFLPILEFQLELVHTMPDGRKFRLICPRVSVSPENPQLQFDDADWIGTDLNIEVLASADPQFADEPFGHFEIEHPTGTQQELLGYNPETYSVGSFALYLTPLNATTAAAHGMTQSTIDVGNVRVGSIEATQEFLRHYYGVPKVKDKTVLLQKELTITATIENLNSTNIALLFDGEVASAAGGYTWKDDAKLVTVPANIATPEGRATWIPLNKIKIDPS